jgi:hypothetical protein
VKVDEMKKSMMLAITILLASVIPLTAFVESTGDTSTVFEAALSKSGSGVAEWSSESACDGDWSIHLAAPGKATWNASLGMGEDVNEGRVHIILPSGTSLGDIESVSWMVNTTSGYPPHVDLLLDLNGDEVFDGGSKDIVTGESLSGGDDVLVAEFAYQPYVGPGYAYISLGVPYGHYAPEWQGDYYYPSYNTCLQTFQNSTGEAVTVQLDNSTVLWLYSGLPGPYSGGYFGTLADFKDGVVQVIDGTDLAPVNATTVVLELQIEVDNWLGPAEAYLDNFNLNGEPLLSELMPPEIVVEKPENMTYVKGAIPVNISTSDPFGVSRVWYNVKKKTGDWVYAENQTYTIPTDMPGFAVGEDYHFYAWANNSLSVEGENSTVYFSVAEAVPLEAVTVDVRVNPRNLNLKSRGRWITVHITPPPGHEASEIDVNAVEINGEVEADWGNVEDGVLMVKFDRSAVAGILRPGDEVEITVAGSLTGGNGFGGSDTIRVINPGNGNGEGESFGLGSGGQGGNGNKGDNGHGNGNGNGKGGGHGKSH